MVHLISRGLIVVGLLSLNWSCAARFRSVTTQFQGDENADANKKKENADANSNVNNDGDGNAANDSDSDGDITENRFITIQQLYDNGTSGNSEYKFYFTNGFFSTELALKNKTSEVAMTFNQTDRPLITKMFQQGPSGNNYTDNFTQSPDTGVVDILIVMDNSGSMIEEQANMATKMQPLLASLTNTDWRIGVVTTDAGDPCMRAVIKKDDANAAAAFQTAMMAGSSGSGNEQGIRQAVTGLSCPGNAWYRQKSTLAVLIVSDEDNCSNGTGCGSNAWNTPTYLLNHITGMGRTLGSDARVYGLIWHPSTTCSTGYNKANQYAQAIASSSGTYGSICAADYTATLQSISQNIATILKSQFALTETPDAGSVTVTVNGAPFSGFSVAGNVITFTNLPPNGSQIEVKYTKGAGPQLKTYSLGEKPAAGTLSAMINNAPVDASTYTVDQVANTIEFAMPPPPSADIRVIFRRDIALLTDFAIGNNAVAATMQVKINGTLTTAYAYDQPNGLVRFNAAPPDAARIDVAFTRIDGPQLEYMPALPGEGIRDLTVTEKATGKKLDVIFLDGKLTIKAEDFADGKILVLSFRNNESNKTEIKLPHEPMADSLVITSTAPNCSLGNGIEFLLDTLSIDCAVPDNSEFVVKYKYVMAPMKEYKLKNVQHPDLGVWEVRVNGDIVTDYRREGDMIYFDYDLPVGAKVFLSYTYERTGA